MAAPSSGAPGNPDRVIVGRITGPFGVRGWVKVMSFTDPPAQVLEFPLWRAEQVRGGSRELRHAEGRRHGKGFVVRIEGVTDRDAAIALAKPELWIERRELPALRPGEYYRADLIGFEVVNREGLRLGRVDHFLDLPANVVMVVDGERELWVPLGRERHFAVDLQARRVIVDWDPEF